MVGKTVEIIAFEISDQSPPVDSDKQARLGRIRNLTKDKLIDLSGFKFNRDIANDYDDK